MLTLDEVTQAMPSHLKAMANQQLTDRINNIVSDPEIAEQVRQNFVSYASILKDGRFKIEDYLNAVTYVSFKVMGYSNEEAYGKAFPQRYANLTARGCTKKEISGHVGSYHRGKLVGLIMEQTMTPTWILNQDLFQKALNVQAELMRDANSEKVRCDAANSILTHLKPPEPKKVNIDIGVKENSGLTELKDALRDLASMQIGAIESGTPTQLIAAKPILEAEFVEVEAGQTGTR